MRKLRCMIAAAMVLTLFPTSVFAATENDLREVMGLERIEGQEWEKAAERILAQCASQESYNELLDELEEIPDEETEILNQQIQQKNEYYEEYMEKFLAGAPASELAGSLSEYNRLYHLINQTTTDPAIAGELERYDSKTIEQQILYAKTLFALCKSTANIGTVGQEADTFLKGNLRIKDITEDSITCYVTSEDNIYSQLKGVVTKITGKTIEIQSGKATVLTYTGVKADEKISVGCKVKQYQKIGKAVKDSVTVSMTSGMTAENPLKMYGTKGVYWQEEYLRTQPWASEGLDLTKVKNHIDSLQQEETSKSVMTDENGNETELTVENNPYHKEDETVLDDSIQSYLFQQEAKEQ